MQIMLDKYGNGKNEMLKKHNSFVFNRIYWSNYFFIPQNRAYIITYYFFFNLLKKFNIQKMFEFMSFILN